MYFFQSCFLIVEPPKGAPRAPKIALKSALAPKDPKDRPGVAQEPPGSHFEPILAPFWSHVGPMLASPCPPPGFSVLSVWVIVCGSSLLWCFFLLCSLARPLCVSSGLIESFPKSCQTTSPRNHYASKPPRLKSKGPAAWGLRP